MAQCPSQPSAGHARALLLHAGHKHERHMNPTPEEKDCCGDSHWLGIVLTAPRIGDITQRHRDTWQLGVEAQGVEDKPTPPGDMERLSHAQSLNPWVEQEKPLIQSDTIWQSGTKSGSGFFFCRSCVGEVNQVTGAWVGVSSSQWQWKRRTRLSYQVSWAGQMEKRQECPISGQQSNTT